MRYATIRKIDTSNGDGVTCSIFFQGCSHCCKDCWNQSTWDFHSGKELTKEIIDKFIEYANKPYIKGISILGGEPFQQNSKELLYLLILLKQKVNKQIWLWTGYVFKEIPKQYLECLNYIDVLIDGRFVRELKDYSLEYRGSSNQRVIDVKETLKQGRIISYKNIK